MVFWNTNKFTRHMHCYIKISGMSRIFRILEFHPLNTTDLISISLLTLLTQFPAAITRGWFTMLSTRITLACRTAWIRLRRTVPHSMARHRPTTLPPTRTMPRPHPPCRHWPNSITTTRNRTRTRPQRHQRRAPTSRPPRHPGLNFRPPPCLLLLLPLPLRLLRAAIIDWQVATRTKAVHGTRSRMARTRRVNPLHQFAFR